VQLTFTDEQEALREAVRLFLERKSPEPEVRRLMADSKGYDSDVWQQMAQQLGVLGLAIPEDLGGSGCGAVELTAVMEEMGRALFCGPFVSTVVLAANALLQSGDEAAMKEHLPEIAQGTRIATVAWLEESASWELDDVALPATFDGEQWTLTGRKCFVLDGMIADLILVAARTARGLSLFAVRADASGLERDALETMDQTRKQAVLTFAATPARLIGEEGQAQPGLTTTLLLAAVAMAAEQVGGAQKALDMSVEYAKTRVQFGRPIGSFQAIKHKCADMLLRVESARSAAYYAAWTAQDLPEDLPIAASLAKAYCSDAYVHVSAENVQVHGGIGFTWEHPAHLYLKRAKSTQLMLGTPDYHRELLAQALAL